LTASIKAGAVAPSTMLKKLGAYSHCDYRKTQRFADGISERGLV
jgi:hypothetical protein